MGRKSDTPPPIVVPDTPSGYRWAQEQVYGDCDFALCDDFRVDDMVVASPLNDGGRPIFMPACRNRDRSGVRVHNWCYRCPAGFIGVRLDHRDADRDRDGMHVAY